MCVCVCVCVCVYLTPLVQRVKHSKLADGIEQAVSEAKYLPAGVDADSVSNLLSSLSSLTSFSLSPSPFPLSLPSLPLLVGDML